MSEPASITTKDMSRKPGFFLKKARKSPLIIDFHKKPSFVVMAYESYLEYKEWLENKSKKPA